MDALRYRQLPARFLQFTNGSAQRLDVSSRNQHNRPSNSQTERGRLVSQPTYPALELTEVPATALPATTLIPRGTSRSKGLRLLASVNADDHHRTASDETAVDDHEGKWSTGLAPADEEQPPFTFMGGIGNNCTRRAEP